MNMTYKLVATDMLQSLMDYPSAEWDTIATGLTEQEAYDERIKMMNEDPEVYVKMVVED